ncbi:hypothetical protein EVAR_46739_1 [Eumeta japonica]|uniref:Uncharacterized protein n=1 Tax=Eumeta variegata TaxID=151549 RepID=A0A4C1XBR1_EUMVA|nr:hypothetical protein EVAR_46739_1 [Eumeta japonica]
MTTAERGLGQRNRIRSNEFCLLLPESFISPPMLKKPCACLQREQTHSPTRACKEISNVIMAPSNTLMEWRGEGIRSGFGLRAGPASSGSN